MTHELPKRAKTEARKRMARLVLEEYERDPELRRLVNEARLARPKIRAQCADGPRPCPWVSCRWHLAYDITPAGSLKENFPGRELDEMPETCSLDVADRGGLTLEAVAAAMNVVRERIRQVEERLLAELRENLSR